MLLIYALVILISAVYAFLFWRAFRFFLKANGLLPVFLLPLVIFVFGFILRLSGNQNLIDLGFFFTDSTVFFITLLFTPALFLGQIKYWKV